LAGIPTGGAGTIAGGAITVSIEGASASLAFAGAGAVISGVSQIADAHVHYQFAKGYDEYLDELSRSQKRNVEKLNNTINNNLKEHDFSGTLRDLEGDPVPKSGGGYWDHKTEMIQSYDALNSIKRGLEGSLKNPKLDAATREFLQGELDKTNSYIKKIEELFKPFGGVECNR
jgi:hypothetical protein